MSEVFDSAYAAAYDAVYQTKDYNAECNLLEELFRIHGNGRIKDLLDLGCGTGSHALVLAQRGYDVVGVDRSPHMLAVAREKADGNSLRGSVEFLEGDVRTLQMARQFDVVLVMFAVLGYQLENSEVQAALATARRHLRKEGLLIFDVWYGPAVLEQRPTQRFKTIPTEKGEILRASDGRLDISRNVCTVDLRIWRIEEQQVKSYSEEKHRNRYFFPLELELLLESSGFSPLRLGAFPDFDLDPDETTWNVLQVSRAV